jgi:hypothetical protein
MESLAVLIQDTEGALEYYMLDDYEPDMVFTDNKIELGTHSSSTESDKFYVTIEFQDIYMAQLDPALEKSLQKIGLAYTWSWSGQDALGPGYTVYNPCNQTSHTFYLDTFDKPLISLEDAMGNSVKALCDLHDFAQNIINVPFVISYNGHTDMKNLAQYSEDIQKVLLKKSD